MKLLYNEWTLIIELLEKVANDETESAAKRLEAIETLKKLKEEKIGCRHAEKMYIDGEDGKVYHIGYVIGGLWLNVYEIRPMRKEV